MKQIIQFGEKVEGYDIPVLNEREIRAAAGILFVLMFLSILLAVLENNFTMLKFSVVFFLTDILIRVLVNPRYAPTLITGLICLICLIFLFFESAFGICLGCKFYPLFFKEKVQYCPGEVCDVRSKKEIQKISRVQAFIVLAFVAYVILTIVIFNDSFKEPPFDLFGLDKAV